MINLTTLATYLRAESRVSHDITRHALLYAAVTALDALAVYERAHESVSSPQKERVYAGGKENDTQNGMESDWNTTEDAATCRVNRETDRSIETVTRWGILRNDHDGSRALAQAVLQAESIIPVKNPCVPTQCVISYKHQTKTDGNSTVNAKPALTNQHSEVLNGYR